MSHVVITAKFCKACDLCISVCPKDCLEHSDTLNDYGVYPVRLRDGATCTGCSLCAMMCPDTAIEVFRSESTKPAAKELKT